MIPLEGIYTDRLHLIHLVTVVGAYYVPLLVIEIIGLEHVVICQTENILNLETTRDDT